MADLQKTINIVFGAVDNTSGTLSGIADGIDSTVRNISDISEPVANMTDNLLKAEAGIVALGAAMIAFSVDQAAKMKSAVNEIGTLFNATSEQSDTLRGTIQTFASDSTSSIDQITEASYNAISAGAKWTEVTDLLGVAEKGAVAGATDLNTATSGLSVIMNAYGLRTEDAAQNTKAANDVMDAMFVAVQNGKTRMDELSLTIGRVASTASAAKVPYGDLLAAIDALTVGGIKTEEAVTLLNGALQELLNPGKDLSAALGDVSLKSDGLQVVMQKLRDVTGGSADKMLDLFSSMEAGKAAIILANDSAGVFSNTLTQMANRTGKVDEAYKAMADNLNLVTQQMVNSFTVASQKIGEPLLGQWTGIIDKLKLIFQGLQVSIDDGAFDPVFDAINAFGAEVEEFLADIAKNLPAAMENVDWSGLIRTFEELGLDIKSIFSGVDVTSADGLTNVIQTVIDTVETLTTIVIGVVDAWKPLISQFAQWSNEINNADDKSKQFAGTIGGWAQQFETFKGLITGATGALNLMADSLAVIAAIKAGKGLVDIASLITGLTVTGGVATGLGVVVAALGATAVALNEGYNAWEEYKARQDAVQDASTNLARNQAEIALRLEDISDRTGILVTNMDELNKSIDDGILIWDDVSGKYDLAKENLRNYDEEIQAAVDRGISFTDEVNKVAESLGLVGGNAKTASEEMEGIWSTFELATDNARGYHLELVNGVPTYTQYGNALSGVTDKKKSAITETDKLSEREKLAIENTQATHEKLLQLATDKEIAAMKFSIELDIAAINGQVEQVKAAFGSISDFYGENSDVIAKLTEGFSASKTQADRDFFKSQIDRQIDMEQQIVDSQTALNNSIIEMNLAYAKSLLQETIVHIDSNGLDQNIEAFMFEILRRIQTKVVGDRAAFLLGAGQVV